MLLDNPTIRFVLKAISAFGWIDHHRESAAGRGNRVQKKDSPFVLVACAADGRWRVFQQDFDKPLAEFDELQEACDYASELAKTRMDSMVLIGKRRDPAANRNSSMAEGTI
jgi:hypothetical protein